MLYDSSVLATDPKGPGYEASSVCSLSCLLLNISTGVPHYRAVIQICHDKIKLGYGRAVCVRSKVGGVQHV